MPDFRSNTNDTMVMIHGHRGFRGLYPENTVTAFIEAAKLGVDALEMDVVISKDGEVVVSHEAWMNHLFCTRPDGVPVENDPAKYNLYRMAYAEIRPYDCGKRSHPDFPLQKKLTEHKPLLREVIAEVGRFVKEHQRPPMKYNIEIKTEAPDGIFNPPPAQFVKLVYDVIQKAGVVQQVHMQSFDVRVLQEIKRENFHCTVGLLVETNEDLETHLDRLGFLPHMFSPEYNLLSGEVIAHVQELGMLCIPWTVNDMNDMQILTLMGVDGLITDYPDRALAVTNRKIQLPLKP
jgi:glycerophosphoryl diester phosphodiesterase